jgi:hypothetical protein
LSDHFDKIGIMFLVVLMLIALGSMVAILVLFLFKMRRDILRKVQPQLAARTGDAPVAG